MNHSLSRRWLLALLPAVALAGCGGSDSASAPAANQPAASTATSNPTPVAQSGGGESDMDGSYQPPDDGGGAASAGGSSGYGGDMASLYEGGGRGGEMPYSEGSGGEGYGDGMDSSYQPPGEGTDGMMGMAPRNEDPRGNLMIEGSGSGGGRAMMGNAGGGMFGGQGTGGAQGGYGAMGGNQGPPPRIVPIEDADYLNKARYALAAGRYNDAIAFVQAHIIMKPEEATEYLSHMKWLPSGPRPGMGVQLGCGLIVSTKGNTDSYNPIVDRGGSGGSGMDGYGDDMGSPMVMGRNGGGMGMGGGTAGGEKAKSLEKYVGKFATVLTTRFQERWDKGSFGSLFVSLGDLDPQYGGGAAAMPNNQGGMDDYGGYGMEDGSGMGASMGIGAPGAPGMGGRGMGMGMGGPGMGGPGMGGGGLNIANKANTLTPGLLYLGPAESQAELIQKATEAGCHALLCFDVEVEMIRQRNFVMNDTRMRIMSLPDGKTLGGTPKVNNLKAMRDVEKGGSDGVEKYMDQAFTKIDEVLGTKDVPNIAPAAARGRLAQLVNDRSIPTLQTLTEINFYHSQQKITDEEREQAFQLALDSSDGALLLRGGKAQRKAILDKLVPEIR